MKYGKQWERMLAESRGGVQAAELTGKMRARYRSLYDAHAHIRSRPLCTQLREKVLPGLSLYLTLREDNGGDQEAALAECEDLFWAALFPVERKAIPLLRPALRQMSRNTYVPGASEVVEDSPDCFVVNTYRCFILDTLTAAGAPEWTPLYCKTDDWLAALLPKVRWTRTDTLAGDAEHCDFRWCWGGEV